MMPTAEKNFRVFLKPGGTDMRKSYNGLTGIVQNELRLDPFSRSLFVFCNRKGNLLKIIYWDRNGFCIWQKRLEKDRFPWPSSKSEALEITPEELNWLLNGIDFRRAHRSMNCELTG